MTVVSYIFCASRKAENNMHFLFHLFISSFKNEAFYTGGRPTCCENKLIDRSMIQIWTFKSTENLLSTT